MRLTSYKKVEDGWVVSFKGWLFSYNNYFTQGGIHFYNKNGDQPEIAIECMMGNAFEKVIDWRTKMPWSEANPSPAMQARKAHEDAAVKARRAIGGLK